MSSHVQLLFFKKNGQPCVAVAVLTVLSSGSDWDGEISSPPINSAGSYYKHVWERGYGCVFKKFEFYFY